MHFLHRYGKYNTELDSFWLDYDRQCVYDCTRRTFDATVTVGSLQLDEELGEDITESGIIEYRNRAMQSFV